MFTLEFSDDAKIVMLTLRENPSLVKRLKAVNKALALLQANPRHQSLNTHKYQGMGGPNGEVMFEAYAENHTPCAYRIFWHYGPAKDVITILAITAHP